MINFRLFMYLLSGVTITQLGFSWAQCAVGECPAGYFVPELTLSPDNSCYGDDDSVNLTCSGVFGGPPINQCNNGSWVLPAASCEVFTCPRPSDDPTLLLSPNKTVYVARDVVVYGCINGHHLIGTTSTLCDQQDIWNPATTPQCLFTCDAPTISNSTLNFPGPYLEDDTVTVTCNEGYNLRPGSSSSITCTSEGWDYIPECYADCLMKAVGNSDQDSDQQIQHGEVIQINCNNGHSFNQTNEFKALCNDSFITTPIPDSCHKDCYPLAPPTGGNVSDSYLHGTTAYYTCDSTSVMDGPTEATCEDGVWSNGGGEYNCVDISYTCTAPDVVDKEVTLEPNKFVYNASESIQYSCPDGMVLVGSSNNTCIGQDIWDATSPTCEPDLSYTCDPPDVSDEELILEPSKQIYNATESVQYSCPDSMVLVGSSNSTCIGQDTWDTTSPTCEPDLSYTCGPPDVSDKEVILEPSKQVYNASESVKYSCPDGMVLVGSPNNTCIGQDIWETTSPTCAPDLSYTCGPPAVSDEELILNPQKTVYNALDVVTYSCPDGMVLVGSSNTTCIGQDTWDTTSPTCEPDLSYTCVPPDVSDEELILDPRKSVYNALDTVSYSCPDGMILSGSSSSTCVGQDTWDSNSPTCEPDLSYTCVPPDVSDEELILDPRKSAYIALETVSYSCPDGMVLSGSSSSTCVGQNTWDSNPPTCEPDLSYTCVFPDLSDEELILEPTKSVYDALEDVAYSCPDGFQLSGSSSSSTCIGQDTWDPNPPTCEPVPCNPRDLSDDALKVEPTKEKYNVGESITYSCEGNMKVDGPTSATCEGGSDWDPPSLPTCSSGVIPTGAVLLLFVCTFLSKHL